MTIRVFASGSKGNCLAVTSGGGTILVDLGLTCRSLLSRMASCSFDPAGVSAILFTHDHDDHCSALATFVKRFPDVKLFANSLTCESIASKTGVLQNWSVFDTSCGFNILPFSVSTFSTSHDAADSVGYLIDDGKTKFLVATDLGIATVPVKEALKEADIALIESNHDPVMLEQSGRPWELKRRIAGRSGHLSNDDAAALVRETRPPKLKHILLAHLSEECNTPSLALNSMRQACVDSKLSDIEIDVLSQYEPSRPVTL